MLHAGMLPAGMHDPPCDTLPVCDSQTPIWSCLMMLLVGCRRKDYWRAKYELVHVVRTHMGANDARYGCVFQREDSKGRVGVHLSKELMAIAGHALKANITTLGPLVLPISEQLIFFGNLVARKVSFKLLAVTNWHLVNAIHIYSIHIYICRC